MVFNHLIGVRFPVGPPITMYEKFGQFINGKWQKSSGGETYEVINPATEEILGKASKANKKDIEKALQSMLKD